MYKFTKGCTEKFAHLHLQTFSEACHPVFETWNLALLGRKTGVCETQLACLQIRHAPSKNIRFGEDDSSTFGRISEPPVTPPIS